MIKGGKVIGLMMFCVLVPGISHAGMFLYAECKVKTCSEQGGNGNFDICKPDVSNWAAATVQVFKYSGTDLSKQHDGLLGINIMDLAAGDRIGNQVYDSITIQDGQNALEVVGVSGDQAYRKFTVNYSTKTNKITTGHAEVELQKPWKQYVVLELDQCQTK